MVYRGPLGRGHSGSRMSWDTLKQSEHHDLDSGHRSFSYNRGGEQDDGRPTYFRLWLLLLLQISTVFAFLSDKLQHLYILKSESTTVYRYKMKYEVYYLSSFLKLPQTWKSDKNSSVFLNSAHHLTYNTDLKQCFIQTLHFYEYDVCG